MLTLSEVKLRTYGAACGPGPVEEMPVRAVLRQQQVPVEVVWRGEACQRRFWTISSTVGQARSRCPGESLPPSEERPLGSRKFANEGRRLL